MKPHLQRLSALLGPQALLLPVRRGTKKPTGKWRHLTIAAMANPKHIAKKDTKKSRLETCVRYRKDVTEKTEKTEKTDEYKRNHTLGF